MPELPEVETVRKTLDHLLKGKKIQDVIINYSKIIKRPDSVKSFKDKMIGQTIQKVSRRGKFLVFSLDKDVLVSHLRMEGKYRVVTAEDPIDKHTHLIFSLNNGEELRYHDVRKFGTMHLFSKGQESQNPPLNRLGPEPFDPVFSADDLENRLHKTIRSIKQALLDQSIVVGLGNIYVDEVLHNAMIHPLRKANTLSPEEILRIHQSIQIVLQSAITLGGSTIRTYLNGQGKIGQYQEKLRVYGHQGTPCGSCGNEIIKIQSHGRGTHFCPVCQKNGEKL